MRDGILVTIEDFIDELELLFWEKGYDHFRITELFPNIVNTYTVNRLKMQIDNNMVCSNDRDGVIIREVFNLMMFLKDCLVSVSKTIVNGLVVGMLEFKDGDITIEVI